MLSLASPAKINLFLRILHRRADGYHELASLFQAIDLCDRLDFRIAEMDQFTCSDANLPTNHTNLVNKALSLYRRKTGISKPLSIHLEKHIPQQAGLGGGSSNAATTLWACNQLFGGGVSDLELAQWAGEIGSDVSFFLSGGTAYCTGRGEIIRPLPPLKCTELWIIKPNQGLSTPQVYGRLDATGLSPRDPEAILNLFLNGQSLYFNDLEIPAFAAMPELALLKEQLLGAGYSTVLLSGSGSSLFCIGVVQPPRLPDITTYSASFINRCGSAWFISV